MLQMGNYYQRFQQSKAISRPTFYTHLGVKGLAYASSAIGVKAGWEGRSVLPVLNSSLCLHLRVLLHTGIRTGRSSPVGIPTTGL